MLIAQGFYGFLLLILKVSGLNVTSSEGLSITKLQRKTTLLLAYFLSYQQTFFPSQNLSNSVIILYVFIYFDDPYYIVSFLKIEVLLSLISIVSPIPVPVPNI